MAHSRSDQAFAAEARERLNALAGLLATLRSSPVDSAGHIDELMRQLHSLKGALATAGREQASLLAHAAESVVIGGRTLAQPLPNNAIELLLEVTDRLAESLERSEPAPQPDHSSDDLLVRLRALSQRAAPRPQLQDGPPPPPAEPHTRVVVKVSLTSAAPAARAFLALRRLAAQANILDTYPGAAQLKEGHLPKHRLIVTLRGEHPIDSLALVLDRISDIDGVERYVPAPTAPATRPGPSAADPSMRVRVDVLDQLLELSGELVAATGRLQTHTSTLVGAGRSPLQEDADRLRTLALRLDAGVGTARRTEARSLNDALARSVRELSRRTGKRLDFVAAGGEVSMDRRTADALLEPLLHALRNAADHGIEAADERTRLRKPPEGRLAVRFEQADDRLRISVTDDGRGFDVDELKSRAVELGLVTKDDARSMDDARALKLAFLPGLSTRAEAGELSGRGVGMDAVMHAIESLGGSVSLSSVRGQGSHLAFSLPSTVSLAKLLLVTVGRETFALPASRVRRILDGAVRSADGTITVGRKRMRAFDLGELLEVPGQQESPTRWVIVDREGTETALGIYAVAGRIDAVLQPVPPPLDGNPVSSGTALLPSGSPVFVLNVNGLWSSGGVVETLAAPPIPEPLKPSIQAGFVVAGEAFRKLMPSHPALSGFPVETTPDEAIGPVAEAVAASFDVPTHPQLRLALVAHPDSAIALSDALIGRGTGALDAAARDAFLELGNVLASAFLNALAVRTGHVLLPSVPRFLCGPPEALLGPLCAYSAVMSAAFIGPGEGVQALLLIAMERPAMDALVAAARPA